MSAQSALRDTTKKATSYANEIMDFAAAKANEAKKTLNKQWDTWYPEVTDTARAASEKGWSLGKGALATTGGYLGTVGTSIGSGIGTGARGLESIVLKGGLLYLGYKLFSKNNDNGQDVLDQVKEEIRATPVKSACIALGAGFILGKLLR